MSRCRSFISSSAVSVYRGADLTTLRATWRFSLDIQVVSMAVQTGKTGAKNRTMRHCVARTCKCACFTRAGDGALRTGVQPLAQEARGYENIHIKVPCVHVLRCPQIRDRRISPRANALCDSGEDPMGFRLQPELDVLGQSATSYPSGLALEQPESYQGNARTWLPLQVSRTTAPYGHDAYRASNKLVPSRSGRCRKAQRREPAAELNLIVC